MLSETRERFVKVILQHVQAERIAEIHFFPPIRQGGTESGVAVVAAEPEEQEIAGEETVAPDSAETPGQAAAPDERSSHIEPVAVDERAVLESDTPSEDLSAADAPAEDAEAGEEPPAPRYTVYTARYRLVLKGPERGKWDAAVVAEADAPLVTVDAVVRGVQRRSGESDEPERMSGEELRAALQAAAPR